MMIPAISILISVLSAVYMLTRDYVKETLPPDIKFKEFVSSITSSSNKDFIGSTKTINGYDYYTISPRNLLSDDKKTCIAFLHGFPDTLMTWHNQLYYFKSQGYHTFAFGLKGFYSDQFVAYSGFDLPVMAADLIELMSTYNAQCEDWHLVGHDWGGIIGRVMLPLANSTEDIRKHLMTKPKRIEINLKSFTSIAIPNISNFIVDALRLAPQQALNQWHFFFFQLPFLPELWLSNGGLPSVLKTWSRNHNAEHHQHVVDSLTSSPAILTSAMHYYRRNVNPLSGLYPNDVTKLIRHPISSVLPIQYIGGKQDNACSPNMYEAPKGQSNVKIDLFDSCGHYPHLEQTDKFNEVVLNHIKAARVVK